MFISFCMSNGGMYKCIKTIDKTPVEELNSTKVRSLLTTNDFIDIEFGHASSAVVRTKYISSVNFEPS